MKVKEYIFEITVFMPALRQERHRFELLSDAVAALCTLPDNNAAIFVAALGEGVDYGNFYLFLNAQGVAHVMLYEHREHFAVDPNISVEGNSVQFTDEDGTPFSVESKFTMSGERGKLALEYWLPNQAHWQQLIWR